jgi:hypothetical protein
MLALNRSVLHGRLCHTIGARIRKSARERHERTRLQAESVAALWNREVISLRLGVSCLLRVGLVYWLIPQRGMGFSGPRPSATRALPLLLWALALFLYLPSPSTLAPLFLRVGDAQGERVGCTGQARLNATSITVTCARRVWMWCRA